jgi:hypothetical protein
MTACCNYLLEKAITQFLPGLSRTGKLASHADLASLNLGRQMTVQRPLANSAAWISKAVRSRSTKRVRKNLVVVGIVLVEDEDFLADDLGVADVEATS